MKCKKCGGELLFQSGVYVCQSCGVTFTLDSIYENIDVCICYEENDAAGRRTRDSIVAQEVYRKLEERKVDTFYERISANGMTGSDLEESKLAAIHRAKVIIVLGTSVENFTAIEEKYSVYFSGKTVIPFCVDVNPGAIPKTLSKVQAMSYSTIGWDKDLIKGIYNILGREQTVDTGSLYGRRKSKIMIVSIIAAVLVIVGAITALFLLKPANKNDVEGITESTEKSLSQKEIYDNAAELMEQGKLMEALELFVQIPDHPNSAQMIKQIYSKYEGYYQNDNIAIHLDILDNNRVEVEVKIISEESVVSIEVNAEILTGKVVADYIDNNNVQGKINLILCNDGITLQLQSDNVNSNIDFRLSEKSDQPIVQMSKEILFHWLKNEYTYNQIRNLGYDLEHFYNMPGEGEDVGGENVVYKITGTDVYISMTRWGFKEEGYEYFKLDDAVLIGVAAPAELIAPQLVGKTSLPTYDSEIIYWPNAFLMYCLGSFEWETQTFASSDTNISNNTIIGTLSKTCKYGRGITEASVINEWISDGVEKTYNNAIFLSRPPIKVAENKTYYLYKLEIRIDETVSTHTDLWAWCKVDKSTWKTTFVTDRTVVTNSFDFSSDYSGPDFSDNEYPVPSDIASEFPDLSTSSNTQQNVSNKPNNENPSEDPVKKTFSNWKEAYLYVIDYAKDEHVSYALVHIDDDNIPELYMNGISEARGDGLYSFKNGKVIELRLGGTRAGRYIEKSGSVYNYSGKMGYYDTEIYKLGADGFSLTFKGFMEEAIIQNDNGDYESSYVYSIDGISVNEEEYTNAINQVFNIDNSTLLYQNAVEYSLIKNQINNYSA